MAKWGKKWEKKRIGEKNIKIKIINWPASSRSSMEVKVGKRWSLVPTWTGI